MVFNSYVAIQKLGIRSASSATFKQAKILQKLITNSKSKREWKANKNEILNTTLLSHISGAESNCKRMKVLNKTYMMHISQVMACGKNASQLEKLGIELTEVKIDKTLSNLDVLWQAQKKIVDDEELTEVLMRTASELQYDIKSFRIMGKWPKIRLIRDVAAERLKEVDHIINSMNLNDVQDSFEQCNEENDEMIIHFSKRHDVFGLDHYKVMNRIKMEINRKQAIDLKKPEDNSINSLDNCEASKLIPFCKSKFLKHYKKQQIIDRLN